MPEMTACEKPDPDYVRRSIPAYGPMDSLIHKLGNKDLEESVFAISPACARRVKQRRREVDETTLIRMGAVAVVDGAINADVFEAFVLQVLVPRFHPSSVNIMGNLSSHKRPRTRFMLWQAMRSMLDQVT